jgi:hypothetical protein
MASFAAVGMGITAAGFRGDLVQLPRDIWLRRSMAG